MTQLPFELGELRGTQIPPNWAKKQISNLVIRSGVLHRMEELVIFISPTTTTSLTCRFLNEETVAILHSPKLNYIWNGVQ